YGNQYFAGITGYNSSATLRDTYFGNSNASDNTARINEYTSSASHSYAVSGGGTSLTLLYFYSSANFNIVSANGLSPISLASTNAYMLNGTYSGTPAGVTGIATNVLSSENITGFDFTNIWSIDSYISNGYTYPVLIGNINSHDVTFTIKTEGVEFVSGENAMSGGTVIDTATTYNNDANKGNSYVVNKDIMYNEPSKTYEQVFYSKAIHINTVSSHIINITPSTGYHLVKVVLDGITIISLSRYSNGLLEDDATNTHSFDINEIITSTYSSNYNDEQKSFTKVSEHIIEVIFSKDFYYVESGLYDYTDNVYASNNGSTAYSLLANKYGTINTYSTNRIDSENTYTNKVKDNTKHYNNNTLNSNTWTLSNSVEDYYYTDVNIGRNVINTNSYVEFEFTPNATKGEGNILISTRVVGWVYVPYSTQDVNTLVTDGYIVLFNSDGTITYPNTDTNNYFYNAINSNSILIENVITSTSTLNTITPYGNNTTSTYVSSSKIKIMPNSAPNGAGTYYAIVDYISTGTLVNQLHYHSHSSECYNGLELNCQDEIEHEIRHDLSNIGDGKEYPDCLITNNSTITYGVSNTSATWGDYIPNGEPVTINIKDYNPGSFVSRFSRTFFDTATNSIRTYYFVLNEVVNERIDQIYEIVDNSKQVLYQYDDGNENPDLSDPYYLLTTYYGLINARFFEDENPEESGEKVRLDIIQWNQNTAGEYAFVFSEKYFDITYQFNNPEAGITRLLLSNMPLVDSETGSSRNNLQELTAIKVVDGDVMYYLGQYNEATNPWKVLDPDESIQEVVTSYGYNLTFKISYDIYSNIVTLYAQLPVDYYPILELNPNQYYRITDEKDCIIESNLQNKDPETGTVINYTKKKYTSYIEDASYEIVNVRTNSYLYYTYSIDSTNTHITKQYFYDHGRLTKIDEKMVVNVTYKKDYYSYFDQLGLATDIPEPYRVYDETISDYTTSFNTALPTSLLVNGTNVQVSDYINNYLNFVVTGKDGLSRETAFVIDNPYKLGYLAYLINNNKQLNDKGYDTYYYQILGNLDMSDSFWLSISSFSGVMFALEGADNIGQINNLLIQRLDKDISNENLTTYDFAGIFDSLNNASIVNITFNNIVINSGSNAETNIGILSNTSSNAYIDRVIFRNVVVNNTYSSIYGFVYNAELSIFNQSLIEITINDDIENNNFNVIGISTGNNNTILDCYAYVNYQTSYTSDVSIRFGDGNINDCVFKITSNSTPNIIYDLTGNNYYITNSTVKTEAIVVDKNNVTANKFTGLDMVRIWKFIDNGDGTYTFDFNKLSNTAIDANLTPDASSNLTGGGTEFNPYLINNINDFMLFINNMNSNIKNSSEYYYKLTTDIDLTNYYVPMIQEFNANFDGDGHKISNMYLYNNNSVNTSFINQVGNTGVITKVFVVNTKVVGSYNSSTTTGTSGFVGFNYGKVSKVSVSGEVVSNAMYTAMVICANYGTADTIISTSYVDYVGANNGSTNIVEQEINSGVSGTGNYVSGVIGGSSNTSVVTSLGSEGIDISGNIAGGVIAIAENNLSINNIYSLGNLFGIYCALVIGEQDITINNAYATTTGIFISLNNGNVTISNANYITSATLAVTTGTITQTRVNAISENNFNTNYFSSIYWDFVRVWSVYGSTPVFKYFNDYIIQLPEGEEYVYILATDIDTTFGTPNKYFTYMYEGDNSTLRRIAGKYIIVKNTITNDDYIIEINNKVSGWNITETGSNGSTLTISEVAINDDSTVYIYRGANATLNVTSVIYRHISNISMKHHNESISTISQNYDMTYDSDFSNNHNSLGNKTGVNFVMNPTATISDKYDRNRFDYYIEITEDIDTYDISISKTQNTSVTGENLLSKVTLTEKTSGGTNVQTPVENAMSTDDAKATISGVKHGNTIRIELTL
ncbi:MAG: hypothetical protein ACI4PF_06190, partial [Christensenellales bacterium]